MPDSNVMSQNRLRAVPFGAPVSQVKEILDADGAVILEGVLSPAQIAQVNTQLDPPLAELRSGAEEGEDWLRDFHGELTKRLTGVVTTCPELQEAVFAHPTMLEYIGAVYEGVADTFWLNTAQVIEILPGEKAQVLHRDMGNYPVFFRNGPDGPEVMCNLILALMDVTEEAGATRVIPGSHKWPFDAPFSPEMTIPASLRAGSALLYGGKLVHGGGANLTKDVKRRVLAVPYNPGFLVPEEAYPFTVSIEEARKMSPRMQQLIGFRSIHQRNPLGGSLWQRNYQEIANFLGL